MTSLWVLVLKCGVSRTVIISNWNLVSQFQEHNHPFGLHLKIKILLCSDCDDAKLQSAVDELTEHPDLSVAIASETIMLLVQHDKWVQGAIYSEAKPLEPPQLPDLSVAIVPETISLLVQHDKWIQGALKSEASLKGPQSTLTWEWKYCIRDNQASSATWQVSTRDPLVWSWTYWGPQRASWLECRFCIRAS